MIACPCYLVLFQYMPCYGGNISRDSHHFFLHKENHSIQYTSSVLYQKNPAQIYSGQKEVCKDLSFKQWLQYHHAQC